MSKCHSIILILVALIAMGIDAQEVKRITITELSPLGEPLRTITVNAIYVSTGRISLSLEGGFEVMRESTFDQQSGRWSNWQVISRSPANFSDIRTYFNQLHREIIAIPNGTRFFHVNGFRMFRIATIPIGRSSAIWWSDDGRSIITNYEWYITN
jgi:hypothetical protein